MLKMNYWDDDKPWSRGTRGGIERGPGGSNWKVSGFPAVLVPAYSLLKQEQLRLAQASFRNLSWNDAYLNSTGETNIDILGRSYVPFPKHIHSVISPTFFRLCPYWLQLASPWIYVEFSGDNDESLSMYPCGWNNNSPIWNKVLLGWFPQSHHLEWRWQVRPLYPLSLGIWCG